MQALWTQEISENDRRRNRRGETKFLDARIARANDDGSYFVTWLDSTCFACKGRGTKICRSSRPPPCRPCNGSGRLNDANKDEGQIREWDVGRLRLLEMSSADTSWRGKLLAAKLVPLGLPGRLEEAITEADCWLVDEHYVCRQCRTPLARVADLYAYSHTLPSDVRWITMPPGPAGTEAWCFSDVLNVRHGERSKKEWRDVCGFQSSHTQTTTFCQGCDTELGWRTLAVDSDPKAEDAWQLGKSVLAMGKLAVLKSLAVSRLEKSQSVTVIEEFRTYRGKVGCQVGAVGRVVRFNKYGDAVVRFPSVSTNPRTGAGFCPPPAELQPPDPKDPAWMHYKELVIFKGNERKLAVGGRVGAQAET